MQGERLYHSISEAGFRCYSQFDEDGIILYVLSTVGMKTKRVVEICCADGTECMASNLIINHGYQGFLFDGDPKNIEEATRFFNSKKDCFLNVPKLKQAWITKDNINNLLREVGAEGEVDLLSIDIDGNDYHIWEAISVIQPRLCVIETHNSIPADYALTMPYSESFDSSRLSEKERGFRSASLMAVKKLAEKKGYRLIGGHKHGFNVFFLRNDLGLTEFPEVSIDSVHDNPWTRLVQKSWPELQRFPWQKV